MVVALASLHLLQAKSRWMTEFIPYKFAEGGPREVKLCRREFTVIKYSILTG